MCEHQKLTPKQTASLESPENKDKLIWTGTGASVAEHVAEVHGIRQHMAGYNDAVNAHAYAHINRLCSDGDIIQ